MARSFIGGRRRRGSRKPARQSSYTRRLLLEPLEDRRLLAGDWHNALLATDVNADRRVSPIDAVQIINRLKAEGSGELPAMASVSTPDAYYDTSNDGFISPLDSLLVINAIAADADGYVLTDIASLNSNQIQATFDRPVMGALLSPDAYVLTGPDSSRLEILGVAEGESPFQVTLSSAAQSDVTYTLALDPSVTAAISVVANVKGKKDSEFFLQSAVALGSNSVLLTFSDPVDSETASVESFYRIAAANGGLVDISNATVEGRTVLLETSSLQNIDYQVTVTNVLDGYAKKPSDRDDSTLIDPARNTANFRGIPPTATPDNSPPTLDSAVATTATTLLLSFSEPLADHSADPTHYTITDADGNSLTITEAVLSPHGTQVLLTTLPQTDDVEYSVTAKNVPDRAGNVLVNGSTTFTGSSASRGGGTGDTQGLPRVVGAASTGNTSVIVSFSQSMGDSALDPSHYVIVQENVHPEAGALLVTGAEFVDNGNTTVKLTTMSQNELTYTVTVVDVRDAEGNPMAPPVALGGVTFYPSTASFPGTPPVICSPDDAVSCVDTLVDSDGDGLTDNEEQRGWLVSVTLLDGSVITRQVTSDPLRADTDQDGFLDSAELALSLDPRDQDTDDDLLPDEFEFNTVFSNPASQDTDGDGLDDGSEHDFFHTSPLLADTDGDQFTDDEEIILDNRNPLLADLPRVVITTGNVDLRLDVRFEAQTSQGTTTVDSKSVNTTLTQTQESAQTSESSSTSEWFFKAGAEVCVVGGCEQGGAGEVGGLAGAIKAGGKFNAEAGGGGSTASTFTTASSRATQREFATSLTSDKEVSAESVVTRVVEGASIGVSVNLVNASNVAFAIRNIEITALIQDPRDPTSFTPVATLFAASDEPVTIGPLNPTRGPFRFTAAEAFPALVESLMQNPRSVLFRVANYEIEDEFGRNFSFVEQDIHDRTAFFEIDYKGELPLEKHRVATTSDFDENGKPVGLTMTGVLQDLLGLRLVTKEEDEALVAQFRSDDPEERFEAANEIDRSYSLRDETFQIRRDPATPVDPNNPSTFKEVTRRILYRVKGVSSELTDPNGKWWVIGPQGLATPAGGALGVDFDSLQVFAGQDFAFKFVKDLDNDALEADLEAFFRSIDSDENTPEDLDNPDSADTDDDGIDDGDEVYGLFVGNRRDAWTIRLEDGQDAYRTTSNPGRADTDLDGLTDCQELGLCEITVRMDSNGLPTVASDRWAGFLTTRTDADTAIIGIDGHDFVLNDVIDLSWEGGQRSGMTVTSIAGNKVTLNAGSGDAVPELLTAVVVAGRHEVISRFFRANPEPLEVTTAAPLVIDDGDPSFKFPLDRTPLSPSTHGGVNGDYHFSAAGPYVAGAVYQFGKLPAGFYRVSATWPQVVGAAPNANFEVNVDGVDYPFVVDQTVLPNDFTDQGVAWESLGFVRVDAGHRFDVYVQSSGGGKVIADAIRVERVSALVIDNGDPGFNNSLPDRLPLASSTSGGFDQDHHFLNAGAFAAGAVYNFGKLPTGFYRVSATWPQVGGAAPNANFDVNVDGVDYPFVVDQTILPNDFTDQGVAWEDLGVFRVDAGNRFDVFVQSSGVGKVLADAIRVERVRLDTFPTDPSNPDTDGDGLTDAEEIAGFAYVTLLGKLSGSDVPEQHTLLPDTAKGYATNPLSRDTDNDGFPDWHERQLGTDATVNDRDSVRDDDGDGLVNLQETTGWDVTWEISQGSVQIIDNSSSSFTKVSPELWGDAIANDAYGNDHLFVYSQPVTPNRVAKWDFGSELAAGQYRISATWPVVQGAAPDTLFRITVNGVQQFLNKDQTGAPDDFSDQGVMWENLIGAVELPDDSTLTIEVLTRSNKVIADAIRVERLPLVGALERVTPSRRDPDSDDDGLNDWEEFNGCRDRDNDLLCDDEEQRTNPDKRWGPTNPNSADTDGDGLTDREEVDGVDFLGDDAIPFRFTDPLDWDTDNDGRGDGDEVNVTWEVKVVGQPTREVYSDPLKVDADGDGLKDGDEFRLGSDPNRDDTDGDGALDGVEADRAEACASLGALCLSTTDVLVPDRWISVEFLGLTVGKASLDDGDPESSHEPIDKGAGDFTYALGITYPVQTDSGYDLTYLFLTGDTDSSITAICGNFYDTKCRASFPHSAGTLNYIQMREGSTINVLHNKPGVLLSRRWFAVPDGELFAVSGEVTEWDFEWDNGLGKHHLYRGSQFQFGGVGSSDGMFTTIDVGTQGIAFESGGEGPPVQVQVVIRAL